VDLMHINWPLHLSKGMSGSVSRFDEQVVLRIDGIPQGFDDSPIICNVAISRANAVHLASRLREAAIYKAGDRDEQFIESLPPDQRRVAEGG
jgi:hypothetical protein